MAVVSVFFRKKISKLLEPKLTDMKKIVALCALLLIVFGTHATKMEEFFNKTDIFLKKYVIKGDVDYLAIKKNPAPLNHLLGLVEDMPIGTSANSNSEAFLINAYNLLVINAVIKYRPKGSPKEIPGFYDRKKFKVARQFLTLDDIEKRLYKDYKDARIHLALGRGCKGAKGIFAGAYKPASLDAKLSKVTAGMVNHENYVKVDNANQKVAVSKVFKIAMKYGYTEKQILAFINKHRKSKLASNYTLSSEYLSYNWKLNMKK